MVGARPRILFPAILAFASATVWSQTYDEQAHGLAQKISASLKPCEAVALWFRNISAMTPSEVNAAGTVLERELRALGVPLAEPAAAAVRVAVTFSENLRESVWVAEIRHPDRSDTAMEFRPKPPVGATAPPVTIEKKLLLDEDQRILDLALMARDLLVLDSEAVSVYETSSAHWQRKLSVRIPSTRPWPRDLRGRLMVQGDAYQAYLPGLTCQGNMSGGLSITCREESLWPVGAGPGMLGFADFSLGRNLFSGRVLAPNGSSKSFPPFFSAAALEPRRDGVWAFAGADARIHLYNSAMENAGGWAGWGSDIASVESECGMRSQVLATASGDGGIADSVTAYEIVGSSPQLAGDAVSFPGPVTALWAAAERSLAFAVSYDLGTGRYAAFRLAITCAH
jgi:hypothetical protein